MIKAIGVNTAKVYAIGRHHEEVMRQLLDKYPSFEMKQSDRDRESVRSPILPEPMQICIDSSE